MKKNFWTTALTVLTLIVGVYVFQVKTSEQGETLLSQLKPVSKAKPCSVSVFEPVGDMGIEVGCFFEIIRQGSFVDNVIFFTHLSSVVQIA